MESDRETNFIYFFGENRETKLNLKIKKSMH